MKRQLFTAFIILIAKLVISQPHDYVFCYGNISLTLFANGTVEQVRYDFNGNIVKKISGKYKNYGKGSPTELLKITFDISDVEYSYDLIRDGLGNPAHILDRQGRQYDICKIAGLESEKESTNKLDVFKKLTEVSASDMYTLENKITSAQNRISQIYSDIDNRRNKRYSIPDRLKNLEETDFFKSGRESMLNSASIEKLNELRNISKVIEKENFDRTGNILGVVKEDYTIDTIFINDEFMEIAINWYYHNGFKSSENNYIVNFNDNIINRNPISKGAFVNEVQSKATRIKLVSYYENGQIKHYWPHTREGLKNGRWIDYDDKGNITSYTNYLNGKKEGESFSTIAGHPESLNYFKNDKIDSLQFEYVGENFQMEGYDFDHPYSIAMYKTGTLIYKEVYFYNNDRTIKHIEYKEYYPPKYEDSSEVQVKSEGLLDSNKNKIGTWKYYKYDSEQKRWIPNDFRGELIRQENY